MYGLNDTDGAQLFPFQSHVWKASPHAENKSAESALSPEKHSYQGLESTKRT